MLSFNGTQFELQTESLYHHTKVDLGSYEGNPFVVGGINGRVNGTYINRYNCKTEMFNITSKIWEEHADYSFASY